MHRLLDELRGVVVDAHIHSLGQRPVDLVKHLPHALAHRDGVRTALLLHTHALGGSAVHPPDPADVLEPVLHERHVLEVDRRLPHAAQDEIAERLQVQRLAEHANVELAAGGLESPGGQLDMLPPERTAYVSDRQAFRVELVRVDPDAHVALQVAAQHDLSHTRHGLEALLQAIPCVIAQDLVGERSGNRRPHDGRVLGIAFTRVGRLEIAGEPALCLGYDGLDVLHGQIDIA